MSKLSFKAIFKNSFCKNKSNASSEKNVSKKAVLKWYQDFRTRGKEKGTAKKLSVIILSVSCYS